MAGVPFSWRDPRFTLADVVTGARLVMLPYLLYALVSPLPALAAWTFAAMVATDLLDGPLARRLGQARPFGAALDSTVDFVVIYTLFSALFVIDLLPWWKWAVILSSGLLIAAAQLLHLRRAGEVALAPAPAAKAVGQIQFVYLPFLLARAFWLQGEDAATVDHILFAVLAIAIIPNSIDHARLLRRLLAGRTGQISGGLPAARV